MSTMQLDVSVVMSVYNGAASLPVTLKSVLAQEGCSLEFIVVNDGSTDTSGAILDDWASRDPRLRVLHQKNMGLTRALVNGCRQAQGTFIARQDCGDQSLPGRLALQCEALRADGDCVAVSCFTRFVGPRGEELYTSEVDEPTLHRFLNAGSGGRFRGPSHHGSVMMRRKAHEQVGGYRTVFYFAQDLDLWTRLAELGRFAVLPRVLYEASLDPGSITGTQTKEQQQMSALIAEATVARRSGRSEEESLSAAATIRPVRGLARRYRMALGHYFIGSCLLRREPRAAAHYFSQAIALKPFLLRAWVRWAQCRMARWIS
jgi:glycosyltransferase involved in cell wall biosynthesis